MPNSCAPHIIVRFRPKWRYYSLVEFSWSCPYTNNEVHRSVSLCRAGAGLLLPGTLGLEAGNATAVANGTYVGNGTEAAAEVAKYVGGSKLDENGVAGSLNKEVEALMFGLGVCSFNVDSLVGLGLADAFAVDQLVRVEIFLINPDISANERAAQTEETAAEEAVAAKEVEAAEEEQAAEEKAAEDEVVTAHEEA
ncbi:hypothetical protein DL768_001221 [Monosporascus sp. mg162]|nr:hypothetical protein DL768_001221 [Monosporascus sp. mg162]